MIGKEPARRIAAFPISSGQSGASILPSHCWLLGLKGSGLEWPRIPAQDLLSPWAPCRPSSISPSLVPSAVFLSQPLRSPSTSHPAVSVLQLPFQGLALPSIIPRPWSLWTSPWCLLSCRDSAGSRLATQPGRCRLGT